MVSIQAHIALALYMSVNLNEFTICTFKNTPLTTNRPSHTPTFHYNIQGRSSLFMIELQDRMCLSSVFWLAPFIGKLSSYSGGRGVGGQGQSFKWMFSPVNPRRARIHLPTMLKRTHHCTFTTMWQDAWQLGLVEERLILFHNSIRFQSIIGEGTVWFRATKAIWLRLCTPSRPGNREVPGTRAWDVYNLQRLDFNDPQLSASSTS